MIIYISLILCAILLITQFFKTKNVVTLIMGVFFGAYAACDYLGGFNIIVAIISVAIILISIQLVRRSIKLKQDE